MSKLPSPIKFTIIQIFSRQWTEAMTRITFVILNIIIFMFLFRRFHLEIGHRLFWSKDIWWFVCHVCNKLICFFSHLLIISSHLFLCKIKKKRLNCLGFYSSTFSPLSFSISIIVVSIHSFKIWLHNDTIGMSICLILCKTCLHIFWPNTNPFRQEKTKKDKITSHITFSMKTQFLLWMLFCRILSRLCFPRHDNFMMQW